MVRGFDVSILFGWLILQMWNVNELFMKLLSSEILVWLFMLVIKLFFSLYQIWWRRQYVPSEGAGPSAFPWDLSSGLLADDLSEGWLWIWLGKAAKRQLGVCAWPRASAGQKWGKKLSLWQLCLPVWTTSTFIAFKNALMSVITTDYTTFFFIVCVHRHGMVELQLISRNEILLCLIKTKQNDPC